MVRLNDNDYASAQSYLDFARRSLEALGLAMVIDGDMEAFHDFYNSIPKKYRSNFPASLDPRFSNVGNDAFWLKVIDADNTIVACHGQRLFETKSLIRSLASHRAHRDRLPSLDWHRPDMDREALNLDISGRVVIGGGLWIRKDWRGKAGHPVMVFNRANRAIALRHYEPDWYVGYLKDGRTDLAISPTGAAYAHVVSLQKGEYAPAVMAGEEPGDFPVILAFSSARECLATMESELASDAGTHRQLSPRPQMRRPKEASAERIPS